MVGLVHHQLITMGTARMIEPGLGEHPRGLHLEGIVIHPSAHRVAVVARIGIGGRFPSIRPDDPVIAVKRTQDDHLLGGLHHVEGPEFPEKHVGKSQRITLACRVIGQHGVHLPHAWARGLVFLERFQPCRRVRQRLGDPRLVLSPAFLPASSGKQRRVFSGTTDPQCLCGIPDARQITARGWTAGLFPVVGGPLRRDLVPFLVLCAQKRREHPCCQNGHDRNDQALGHRRNLLGLLEPQPSANPSWPFLTATP